MVCLINAQRARWRLPGLRESAQLDRAARELTDRLPRTGVLAHGNTGARANRVGYRWSLLGENIATGFATPAAVVRAWMRSAGHCRNILDPGYRNVGVAAARPPLRHAAGGLGTWTVDFGRRLGQRARSNNDRPAAGCPH